MLLLLATVLLVPAWRKAVLGHLTWRFGVWLLLPPCGVVAFALLSLNFAADRLRDRLDPASAG